MKRLWKEIGGPDSKTASENTQYKWCISSSGSLKKTASQNQFLQVVFLTKPHVEIMYFYRRLSENQISSGGFLRKPSVEIIWNWFFWVFQMTSYEKTVKIKVVGLKKLWTFIVDKFFLFEIILSSKTTFEFTIFVNYPRWRNYQYKSYRSWKVIKLCSW